jgi:EmrB/QacA subfamily drug resistance transporter
VLEEAMPTTRPRLVTAALLVGTFLAALDLNVVGTALPTMVGQLGGLKLYGLVFSAYLLTSTVTIPLYGRLADLHGRKPVYLAAAALFLLGSGLCGAAPTMEALVAFRALQGLGAGGLIPITVTLFGDLFPAERRALVQGLFSTVWGVSSVLGPLAGGFVVSVASWRWIFWFNLPVGLVAGGMLLVALHEPLEGRAGRGSLNLGGALILTVALACLLLGLQTLEGAGFRALSLGLLGAAALGGALFFWRERRSAAPLLPLELFANRALLVTTLSGLPLGGLLYCTVTLIPLFVQGVLHGTPTRAGLALVPLSVSWTLTTFSVGLLSRRLGYRPVVLLGSFCCAVGAGGLLLAPSTAAWPIVRHLFMIVIGVGMGLTITATTIAVQDVVGWRQRGVATSTMQFARTVGGMVAVTLLGALITSWFADSLGQLSLAASPGELLDPQRWQSFSPAVLREAGAAMGAALQGGLWGVAGLGLAALLINLAFPALRMGTAATGATTGADPQVDLQREGG